jgi:diaminopimelate epimerase
MLEMVFNFSKMEGLGNDFVVFDDRDLKIGNSLSYNDLSVKLCDRHFGVGADGLIVVLNSTTHDIKYRIFNPDGSEPQMCGNGMRCFAKFVYENKIVSKEEFNVETLAGTIIPKVNVNSNGKVETVRVDMGEPIIESKKVPFISKNENAISEEIEIDGVKLNVTAVSMGNPHAVFFVDKATDYLVRTIGSQVEVFERFPEKTNVEFIEVLSKNEMNMRVWERGAGETLACGTGACATLVAAVLNGKTENKALIHLMGGDLTIEWNRDTNHIFKTGPAKLVFNGVLTL